MTRKLATATFAALAALALTGATKPARPAGGANWAVASSVTPEGHHVLGNPKAPLRLVQYVSYTCPHCSAFEVEAEGQLKLGMVGPGKGAVEVRNFVRDPVDVTVALITNCVPANRFFQVHTAFMRAQPQWIGPLSNSTAAQRQRWTTGPFTTRTRAIASDFKFYQFMAARGMDRPAMDRCLANEPLANKLAQQTNDAVEKLGVTGTPSFMIDGVLLAGTHSWDALRPQILARTK
ncbi:MAG: protein-disulfide isomerase [Novosphingobium sp. 17-62-19]|uniref:DsbA family protein n=1 Tax=Novosphingobium sp. 17-62-19 TaxID=1970406 RepID=UPI000BDC4CFA|nr:thioredoxin domain-containing protein [Novosphingobium sp. 17-62-19]OYX95752.1 MAG: protein-disulfide isomerase [Novosphingobium sp. 35-62-5]OZA20959.1 MAG: protein-disulfide isomerase [Novosphingobium sp. 17-62-19]OZA55662.1 MAG: protein-disulfide isomerase [Sphingomonadales bacterium 39-62-4]HQS95449.1 thioredoxin domain-containing protein [Novosphingobium sp.]